MPEADASQRLSRISTCWTLVFQAQQGSPHAISAAQQVLLIRYNGAIYRYLLGALRDPAAAEEVAQEFALCLVRGDFRKACPEGGRFRDLVKVIVFHLVVNYQRQRQKKAREHALPDGSFAAEPADPPPEEVEKRFLANWRDELLERAWEELSEVERQTGQPVFSVLRLRAEQPEIRSQAMAEQLSARLGRPYRADHVRQVLHRAREKFAELLLEEVSRSLESNCADRLEEELVDLGLLAYCRSALEKRKS